jgi:hypothetical protein
MSLGLIAIVTLVIIILYYLAGPKTHGISMEYPLVNIQKTIENHHV